MKKLITLFAIVFCSTTYGQIVNGNMESWRTYTSGTTSGLTIPVGWQCADSISHCALASIVFPTDTFKIQTFQCDTAHSGSYAVKLLSRYTSIGFGVLPGLLTNGDVLVNSSDSSYVVTGGLPVTQRIDSVSAWIKYAPKGGDSGIVNVFAVLAGFASNGGDSIIGRGLATDTVNGTNYITASSAYTHYRFIMHYLPGVTLQPDHIQITFSAGNTVNHDSTAMYVDDVAMYMTPNATPLLNSSQINCYPNPATDVINIETSQYQYTTAELYNIFGQKVYTQPLTGNTTQMNIKGAVSGIYFLHLRDANGEIVYRSKILKN